MTAGAQVFDGNGTLFWDTGMFMGRLLGSTTISAGTGTIVNDGFTTGIPFCIPVLESSEPLGAADPPSTGPIDTFLWLTAPTYAFSGNQLVWNRSAQGYPSGYVFPTCYLYYGVR